MVFKPFYLIDLTTLSDEIIEKHGLVALLETLFKHYRAKDFVARLKRFARSGLLAATIRQTNQGYLMDVLHYVSYSGGDERSPATSTIVEVLTETLPKKRELIMTFGEQLEEQGRQKGEHEKALLIAKNMLAENFDLSLIKKMTGLADEEIAVLI